MKNLICKIFGHKLVQNGYSKMEWTNQGPALINPLKKPIKGESFICKRCGREFARFDRLPTEKDIIKRNYKKRKVKK